MSRTRSVERTRVMTAEHIAACARAWSNAALPWVRVGRERAPHQDAQGRFVSSDPLHPSLLPFVGQCNSKRVKAALRSVVLLLWPPVIRDERWDDASVVRALGYTRPGGP